MTEHATLKSTLKNLWETNKPTIISKVGPLIGSSIGSHIANKLHDRSRAKASAKINKLIRSDRELADKLSRSFSDKHKLSKEEADIAFENYPDDPIERVLSLARFKVSRSNPKLEKLHRALNSRTASTVQTLSNILPLFAPSTGAPIGMLQKGLAHTKPALASMLDSKVNLAALEHIKEHAPHEYQRAKRIIKELEHMNRNEQIRRVSTTVGSRLGSRLGTAATNKLLSLKKKD